MMEPSEVVPTTMAGMQPPRSRPGSSSSGSKHRHTRKPSDPDVLLDSLGLHDLDAEMTETGVQELLRKHSSVAASSGGGITSPSLLPTLNERMSDDSVNDGLVKDLQFVANDTILLSGGGGGGGSGTSPVALITLNEEADEEETADDNDER